MSVMEIDRPSEFLPLDHPCADRETGGGGPVALVANGTERDHFATSPWQPLEGAALLERLRVTGRPRPQADPELTRRLRYGLEQGLSFDGQASYQVGGPRAASAGTTSIAASRTDPPSPPAPLAVTKGRLTRALACEAHYVAVELGQQKPTTALACGALVGALFRQLITIGAIDDPMEDAVAALLVDDHQRELVEWIERMNHADHQELRAEVERQADGLRRRWPTLEPTWLPRTQSAMRVSLAGGSVELSARVDLVIGRAAVDQASVAFVEVKSGVRRPEHRLDLHFFALIETLRRAVPPFVVATYYTRTGELDVEPVTEELLVAAGRRTLTGVRALWSLASGGEPSRTPNTLCGSCAAQFDCGPSRSRTRGSEPFGLSEGEFPC